MMNQAETVTITTARCMLCRKTSAVTVTAEQAEAVDARTPIRGVLPDVGPDARELLISGTRLSCWEELFG